MCRGPTVCACVCGEQVLRGIAKSSRTIRLSDEMHMLVRRLRASRRDLALRLERSPTEAELADAMGATRRHLTHRSAPRAHSVYAQCNSD